MKSECSLPHSQVPATCPYPEPARSSPYLHIPLPEDQSHYYPPIYVWVSPVGSFPQVSPPKPCTRLSSPTHALHAPPILFIAQVVPKYQSTSEALSLNISYLNDTDSNSGVGLWKACRAVRVTMSGSKLMKNTHSSFTEFSVVLSL